MDWLIYIRTCSNFQEDISNFRFKLPAILYNSPLNEARGLLDHGQQLETHNELDGDVTELDELDIIMSGEIKLTRAIKWKSREQILAAICTNIQFIASDKTLLQ